MKTAASVPQEPQGGTRSQLLLALHRNKGGLSVENLGSELEISRNGVRQHLTALERDGLIRKGQALPSGGRPEQLYVLTPKGEEQFPRQYSWFAEILMDEIQEQEGNKALKTRLARLGRKMGRMMQNRLEGKEHSAERIASLARLMNELGYDATAGTADGQPQIEAHNCVYHDLALKNADVCAFDLGLLAGGSGANVEHHSCMVRGGGSCQFRFSAAPANKAK